MRPDAPKVLNGIAAALMAQALPETATPIGQQRLSLAAGLLVMLAQEFDRAAARLVDENAAIRAIFGGAPEALPGTDLAARLAEAFGEDPTPDLHVAALQAENDRLRALLIELHASAEAAPAAAARSLESAIWAELKQSTRRRHLSSGLA